MKPYIPTPLSGKEAVTMWVIGPSGEFTTIILRNECSIKLTFNDLLLYLQIKTTLNPHKKSFYFQYMVTHKGSHNWSKYRE